MLFNDRIPNCVPEYYREQQEKLDREYELMVQRKEHYQANQQKLDAAVRSGLPILDYGGYDSCLKCPDADHDTVRGDDDDFCLVICHNPSCTEHKNHQTKKPMYEIIYDYEDEHNIIETFEGSWMELQDHLRHMRETSCYNIDANALDAG